MKLVPAFALLAALAACGSKPTPTTGGAAAGAAAEPMTTERWAAMDLDARARYMGEVVMPVMGPMLTGFDAEEFPKVDCATCHGGGAAVGDFEMPSPDVHPLTIAEIQAPDEHHAKITEFMMTQVKPTMARLLGRPEYSPETPDGFGCFGCHPMAQ
jgi:hypothetical protein